MEALPIPKEEATAVAEKLLDEAFLQFPVPKKLQRDQGKQFKSKLISEVCKSLGIHKSRTTPCHPPSNEWPCGVV